MFLLLALIAQTSISAAGSSGTELAEYVSADVSGPEASIALLDVSLFPKEGEAVFEPGTAYEEPFTYSRVDEETNRLVGIVRTAPIPHSAGVFVQAPVVEPAATPPPSAPPASGGDQTSTPGSSSTVEGSDDAPTSQPGSPQEIEDDIESDGTTSEDDTTDATDPCSLIAGRTCEAVVSDLLSGIDCTEGPVCPLIGEILAALPTDPAFTCEGSEVCEIKNDPLGPWSVCDPDNTDRECPDPDDFVDLFWEIDDPLFHLDCQAGVAGPTLSDGGSMAKGKIFPIGATRRIRQSRA